MTLFILSLVARALIKIEKALAVDYKCRMETKLLTMSA
jgi:hypothetical protein